MKGAEIIKRFEKAKAVIAERSGRLGEIGDFLRGHGYEVYCNGFSVCHFGERDFKLRYGADCCDKPWHIGTVIYFNDHHDDKLPTKAINPDEDYTILPNPSRVEMLEKGWITPKSFGVFEIGPKTFKQVGECATLEKADELARRLCKEEIERLRKDDDWRPHAASAVRNDEFLAKERGELRHYRDYYIDGREFYFAVRDIQE